MTRWSYLKGSKSSRPSLWQLWVESGHCANRNLGPTIRSARRPRAVLLQESVEFFYAEPLRCALGEAFKAAFGPQPSALGLQCFEV
jgi:hypothetical protein